MRAYKQFVDELECLFAYARYDPNGSADKIVAATNGQAKSELYRLVSVQTRRKFGAFFTDENTAQFAAEFLKPVVKRGGCVCDPACGAGDLLLACTAHLEPAQDLRSTIMDWSGRIFGWDMQQEFVDACRLRLALKSIERSQSRLRVSSADPKLFAGVRVQDGLAPTPDLESVDAVIMNPPFTAMQAPPDTTWAKGVINTSALFLERVVSQVSPGTKIVAILPDVLRSGTRYSRWRQQISQWLTVANTIPLQQFDQTTDIHVFVLVATKKTSAHAAMQDWNSRNLKSQTKAENQSTVGDLFDVSVGPVVEYREPNRGRWLPFLMARDLPAWTKISGDFPKRRFRGRAAKAPFVVVRRTSRPEDKHRAVATIIGGRDEYAVENHLVILQPKDGKLKSCQPLIDTLKRPETSEFLNHVIRCRHLTVSAVKSIPWTQLSEQT